MIEVSKDFPPAFYRVTIKGMCVRDGKLLMIQESEKLSGGVWELPGGGLDFGEDIFLGFNRETQEEMGLSISKISKAPVYVWTWKFENHRNLDWFYSLVVCYRIEFEHLNFTKTDECNHIQFFSEEEIKHLELGQQMSPLPGIFKAADFEVLF